MLALCCTYAAPSDKLNAALPCTFFALASSANWPFCLYEEFFAVCVLAFVACSMTCSAPYPDPVHVVCGDEHRHCDVTPPPLTCGALTR